MLAAESGLGISKSILKEKLIEREKTMSTGVGNNVGVPHAMVEGIKGLHAFVVTLASPIPYDALDKKPVNVVIGLFGEPDRPQLSLATLATLGRMLRDKKFVHSLWAAQNPTEVYRLLKDKEEKKESL